MGHRHVHGGESRHVGINLLPKQAGGLGPVLFEGGGVNGVIVVRQIEVVGLQQIHDTATIVVGGRGEDCQASP